MVLHLGNSDWHEPIYKSQETRSRSIFIQEQGQGQGQGQGYGQGLFVWKIYFKGWFRGLVKATVLSKLFENRYGIPNGKYNG